MAIIRLSDGSSMRSGLIEFYGQRLETAVGEVRMPEAGMLKRLMIKTRGTCTFQFRGTGVKPYGPNGGSVSRWWYHGKTLAECQAFGDSDELILGYIECTSIR
eukprot:TRINITY_DN9066_c0_g1_i1.p1 TRINITY_DN9066_c0_g1~~TRINITY_DN9066_c0_g1_i1.p1  ORF type:complete len:103 (-),score=1.52 TRINITY_DN9066_c0_g1_i1:309-617(-)